MVAAYPLSKQVSGLTTFTPNRPLALSVCSDHWQNWQASWSRAVSLVERVPHESALKKVLFCAAMALCSCSSSYRPAVSPRVDVIVEGGTPLLLRDGRTYSVSPFSDEVVEAFHGNARAIEAARAAHRLVIAGFTLDLLGGASLGTGVAMGVEGRGTVRNVGIGVGIGGLVAMGVGTMLILKSVPNLYDAVNLYNDDLDHAGTFAAPGSPR
jgi:hypothetical protein